MKNSCKVNKRFTVFALSAAIAVSAAGVVPGISFPGSQPAVTANAAEDNVTVSMGLTAGGSLIGINYKLSFDDDPNLYDVTIDDGVTGGVIVGNELTFTFPCCARNMGEEHTLLIKKGDNIIKETKVCVYDYLNKLLADDTYADIHDLVSSMFSYGSAARDYFAGDTVICPVGYKKYDDVTVSASPFDKSTLNSALSGMDAPVSYYGMNLSLRSEIGFSLYFRKTGVDALTFLENSASSLSNATVKDLDDDFACVNVEVAASKLDKVFALDFGGCSTEFSPVQYISAALDDEDTNLVKLCKALYAYGSAAKEYASQSAENKVHSGKATFYDANNSNGCYNIDDLIGDDYTCAMNEYDSPCAEFAGAYLKVTRGDKSINVLVTDLFPTDSEGCAHGNIDLCEAAFGALGERTEGIIDVTWEVISYPGADKAPVSYRFKDGSSEYWAEIQPRNTRYPVAKMEVFSGDSWHELERKNYNYFSVGNYVGTTYTIRLTDIYGNTIIDKNIPWGNNVIRKGNSQFPEI